MNLIILQMLPVPISSNTKKYTGDAHNVDSKILVCNYYQILYA